MKEENKNTPEDEYEEDFDDEELQPEESDDPPKGFATWDAYYADMELQGRMLVKAFAEKEREDQIATEAALIDSVVFKLTQSLETENPEDPDFAKILTRNAKILNNAFEYYLEHADQSKLPDRKIGLGIRMQSQLIRTIDVWRRLENSQNRKTD